MTLISSSGKNGTSFLDFSLSLLVRRVLPRLEINMLASSFLDNVDRFLGQVVQKYTLDQLSDESMSQSEIGSSEGITPALTGLKIRTSYFCESNQRGN